MNKIYYRNNSTFFLDSNFLLRLITFQLYFKYNLYMYLANILRIVMNQFTVSLRLCFFFFTKKETKNYRMS